MTRPIDVERELDQWFSDGPDVVADRVVDAALSDIDSTPQRSAGFGGPWRILPMSRTALSVAAVIAVVVVGALAVRLVLQGPTSSVGGTTTRPDASAAAAAPTSTPTPVPALSPAATACVFPVFLGSTLTSDCHYHTNVMQPTLSFGGVGGWIPTMETTRGIELQAARPGNPSGVGMEIYTLDRLAAKPCDKAWQLAAARDPTTPLTTVPFTPEVGSGPADFFDWLATTPLKFGTPTPTFVGGKTGLETTISGNDGSLAACGGSIAFTWTNDTPGGLGAEGVGDGGTSRIIAIDVDGTTVVFQVFAPTNRFVDINTSATELLASVHFE